MINFNLKQLTEDNNKVLSEICNTNDNITFGDIQKIVYKIQHGYVLWYEHNDKMEECYNVEIKDNTNIDFDDFFNDNNDCEYIITESFIIHIENIRNLISGE